MIAETLANTCSTKGKALMDSDGFKLVDMRSTREFQREASKQAVSVPAIVLQGLSDVSASSTFLSDLAAEFPEPASAKLLVLVADGAGKELGEAALLKAMSECGYTTVVEVMGGWGAWDYEFRPNGEPRNHMVGSWKSDNPTLWTDSGDEESEFGAYAVGDGGSDPTNNTRATASHREDDDDDDDEWEWVDDEDDDAEEPQQKQEEVCKWQKEAAQEGMRLINEEGFVLVDMRSKREFQRGSSLSAMNVPAVELRGLSDAVVSPLLNDELSAAFPNPSSIKLLVFGPGPDLIGAKEFETAMDGPMTDCAFEALVEVEGGWPAWDLMWDPKGEPRQRFVGRWINENPTVWADG
ncbi:hypothetical protein CYMTET_28009 [Cymbomonas tetramitiformis]|uniref:Rhodanese domain-containing protein n=1 Tax=Cymbomonas tetramitiformis TaxID=36881 RepID=A0AAE0FP13_9CHLO|nr:hypothetical protein CYMTET_28009 [Cymbomonas tetramitiformis]